MDEFFKSFGSYYRNAQFDTFSFWAFPVGSVLLIWILTTVGLKFFTKRKKLKTVFVINRAWIASSLIVAGVIIGLICFWWTKNYFSDHPLQLSLLISLFVSMLIAIIKLIRLRGYYTQENVKQITDQPKTPSQLDTTITFLKREFRKNKLFFLIPAFGFLMLLFVLNKGSNLISIVLDNTPSQNLSFNDAKSALSQTISQLDDNNQIIVTSFSDNKSTKASFEEVVKTNNYSPSTDISASFTSKTDANNYISSIALSNGTGGSPIQEVVWQNYLFTKQSVGSSTFKNKILLIITDGVENSAVLTANKFFCSSQDYTNFYPPENTYIIDYFNEMEPNDAKQNALFMQNARNCGYDVQEGKTKDDYSFALNLALTGFQNNWYLIYWTIAILLIMTIIGLIINPKKIA